MICIRSGVQEAGVKMGELVRLLSRKGLLGSGARDDFLRTNNREQVHIFGG